MTHQKKGNKKKRREGINMQNVGWKKFGKAVNIQRKRRKKVIARKRKERKKERK